MLGFQCQICVIGTARWLLCLTHKEVDRQVKMVEEYEGASREAETSVAIFSIVATILAIIALVVSVYQTTEWSLAAISLSLVWLFAAALFLYVSLRNTERAIKARKKTGIATGEVVFTSQ